MKRVFISYSSKDKEFAEKLALDLKERGVGIWFDKWEIKIGDSIIEKINQGIERNDFLAIVLSRASVKSEWVKKELNSAIIKELERSSVFVLPILHEECEIPRLLKEKKYANFVDSYEEGLKEILATILNKPNDDKENLNRQHANYHVQWPEEFKRKSKSKPNGSRPSPSSHPPPPLVPPNPVRQEAIKKITTLYWEYIKTPENMSVCKELLPIFSGGWITDPAITLQHELDFIDCICGVVIEGNEAIAILPSGYSTLDIEGVGRSSLILRLLGITIPYGRLIGLDDSTLNSLKAVDVVFNQPRSPYRLLASDIAYIGNSAGRLSIVPTKGEKISFIWDLARHIFRLTELDYKTGDHRKEPGRAKLVEIFKRIPFSEFNNIFGDKLDAMYPLNKVIILNRSLVATPQPPTARRLEGDERKKHLRDAMLVSLKHGSDFWKRDAEALKQRVEYILDRIDWNTMGPIVDLTISHPDKIIPYYVFDEVEELIQKGELPKRRYGQAKVKVGRGIRYHNDTLITSVPNVDEIQILATSGEKLFSDTFFWKKLCQVKNRKFYLKMSLLDPTSSAVEEREESAYTDKEKKGEGFLRKEIEENIATINRMSDYFEKRKSRVRIQCNLYNEQPLFRMTLIGGKRLLIAPYLKGKRTGYNTVFYDISADKESDLFYGFKKMYERIESTATPIALSV